MGVSRPYSLKLPAALNSAPRRNKIGHGSFLSTASDLALSKAERSVSAAPCRAPVAKDLNAIELTNTMKDIKTITASNSRRVKA